MKRLGIFSFYDKDGVADKYIDYLLRDFVSNVDRLVIVVNGMVDADGYRMFQQYTDHILVRENKGFDAGAYKDAIVNDLGIEHIKMYDQLVLINDTFYGPFIPFYEIFAEMETHQNVDFWGINYVGDYLFDHIQSFFLVFNFSVLKNMHLYEYFTKYINEHTKNIEDVYIYFEIGLFKYLTEQGYLFSSYTYENHCNIYHSSDIAIKNYRLPVMKKRCFAPLFYQEENVFAALKYLHKYFSYDISLILESAERNYNFSYKLDDIINYPDVLSVERLNPTSKVTKKELENFLKVTSRIYVFGAGMFAKRILALYTSYLENVEGIIVSDNQEMLRQEIFGYKVYKLSEINPLGKSVVVALTEKNTEEVVENLKCFNKVFLLWDK